MPLLPAQPSVNIGTAGHVDHGKTTLVQTLTGVWASKHSEELRRGITIRLGYADCAFYKCPTCPPPSNHSSQPKCPNCGSPGEFIRAVSFVDCPGHEVLMTTMLSGAAVMDGALLIIAADARVPQPQTREHLAALEIVGVKNIVIVQNKVDLVTREQAFENYRQIKSFIAGTIAEGAPIIPVSAQHRVNTDAVIEAIEKTIPTPRRDPAKTPYMYVVRSFDINKPGTQIEDLAGGVVGGSIVEGRLSMDEDIEIKPGVRSEKGGRGGYITLNTKVTSLFAGGRSVKDASSGGLVGVGTLLDPYLCKADGLIGNVLGQPGQLPPLKNSLTIATHLFENVIGTPELMRVESLKPNEPIVTNIGTAVTAGVITKTKKDQIELAVKKPVCTMPGSRIALNRKVAGKWRLIGYGILKD
ncbi:MAG: translation initiation factor IF-2 subunit gamma [Candidatus Bathyarchaeia archaeon]